MFGDTTDHFFQGTEIVTVRPTCFPCHLIVCSYVSVIRSRVRNCTNITMRQIFQPVEEGSPTAIGTPQKHQKHNPAADRSNNLLSYRSSRSTQSRTAYVYCQLITRWNDFARILKLGNGFTAKTHRSNNFLCPRNFSEQISSQLLEELFALGPFDAAARQETTCTMQRCSAETTSPRSP